MNGWPEWCLEPMRYLCGPPSQSTKTTLEEFIEIVTTTDRRSSNPLETSQVGGCITSPKILVIRARWALSCHQIRDDCSWISGQDCISLTGAELMGWSRLKEKGIRLYGTRRAGMTT